MTTAEKFKNFPPILCRLLARHRYGGPLESMAIQSKAPGLYLAYIETLSHLTGWGSVNVWDALAFTRGCGLDVDDAAAWRRVLDYLNKRPTFRYLRTSDRWESYYRPMLAQWRNLYPAEPPGDLLPPIRRLIARLTPLRTGV